MLPRSQCQGLNELNLKKRKMCMCYLIYGHIFTDYCENLHMHKAWGSVQNCSKNNEPLCFIMLYGNELGFSMQYKDLYLFENTAFLIQLITCVD